MYRLGLGHWKEVRDRQINDMFADELEVIDKKEEVLLIRHEIMTTAFTLNRSIEVVEFIGVSVGMG